jgi:hypothetical protein
VSEFVRTGYDYIPAPGEDYYPQGKPSEDRGSRKTKTIASGADADLIQHSDGDVVLTRKNGERFTK